MRRFLLHTALFAAVLALAPFAAKAEDKAQAKKDGDLTVEQIVDNALRASYYRGNDGRAQVKMTINDEGGGVRTRELTILRRDDLPEGEKDENDKFIGDQKFYVYFHRPADVRKMAFMVHKHVDRDDDRWLYLPALDLVKRLASSEERTSFAGSHFFYEDVSGRNKDEDTHELIEINDKFYVLKNVPKKPDEVEFSYYKMWIDRKTFLVIQTVYYDENDQQYRKYLVKKADYIDGYPTVLKATMSDDRLGGSTTIEYNDVEYNIGLPDNIFSERYLRRAPIRFLR